MGALLGGSAAAAKAKDEEPAKASLHAIHNSHYGYDGMNTRGSMAAVLNFALLTVLTALVAVLYARDGHSATRFLTMDAWSYTPKPCEGHKDCVPLAPSAGKAQQHHGCGGDERACHLQGLLQEFERPATGLFAVSSVPLLLLSVQVITSAFAMSFVHYAIDEGGRGDANGGWLRKGLKRIAMVVVMTYASFFLFMQTSWALPMNNVLFVEVGFLLALLYIGANPSAAYTQNERDQCVPARFVEMTLSTPLLAAGALAAAGVYDACEIVQAVFSVFFAYALLVALECQRASPEKRRDENMPMVGELLLSSGLVLVPFLVKCCDALADDDLGSRPTWAQAALGLLLGEVLLLHLTVAGFVVGRIWGLPLSHRLYVMAVEGQMIVARAAITLTLLVGALSR